MFGVEERMNTVQITNGDWTMNRRGALLLIFGTALWPAPGWAQQRKPVIALLALAGPNPAPLIKSLIDGLKALGYNDGENIVIETHVVEARDLDAKAASLAQRPLDVIVGFFTPAPMAASRATKQIPIVIANAGDPVETGLVESLARPGGNVTGLSSGGAEIAGKSVDIMKEIKPGMRRIGVIINENDSFAKPYVKQMTEAAQVAKLELEVFASAQGRALEPVFEAVRAKRVEALFVQGTLIAKELFDLAEAQQIPTITTNRLGPPLGAFISYGADLPDLTRQSATYVDKILKGAKPGDIPVAFPTKFDLTINLKTAKKIGLEIPPKLLFTANDVIE
jgi:putative ABC transport system substrate-binding protein